MEATASAIITTRNKKFSLKNEKGFRDGLSFSTPQKSEEQGEMPLPSLSPILLKKWDGMEPRLGNGISLVSSLF